MTWPAFNVCPALSDDDERDPIGWVRFVSAPVDECRHGPAQGLGAANAGRGSQGRQGFCHERDGRGAIDLPMRDQRVPSMLAAGAYLTPPRVPPPTLFPAPDIAGGHRSTGPS